VTPVDCDNNHPEINPVKMTHQNLSKMPQPQTTQDVEMKFSEPTCLSSYTSSPTPTLNKSTIIPAPSDVFLSVPKSDVDRASIESGNYSSQTNMGGKKGAETQNNLTISIACCGGKKSEISLVKVMSILGIFISVVTLAFLVFIFPFSFAIRSSSDNIINANKKNIFINLEELEDALMLRTFLNDSTLVMAGVENSSLPLLPFIVQRRNNVANAVENIMNVIPENMKNSTLSSLNVAWRNLEMFETSFLVLLGEIQPNGTIGANLTTAVALLESNQFSNLVALYESNLKPIDDYANEISNIEDQWMTIFGAVTSASTIFALIVILPLIIVLFISALNKEALNMERLQQAKAVMMIDAMADKQLRELFKQHCQQEHSLENFLLLAQVFTFRELSRRIWEMQEILFADTSSISSGDKPGSVINSGGNAADDTTSTVSSSDISQSKSTSTTHNAIDALSTTQSTASGKSKGIGVEMDKTSLKKYKMPKKVNEKELSSLCKQRFVLAKQILKDFLRVDGKHAVNISKNFIDFVSGQIEMFSEDIIVEGVPNFSLSNGYDKLPDILFDSVEQETAITMLDSFHRFKLGIEFQKQMKIDKISKLNTRRQKKNKKLL